MAFGKECTCSPHAAVLVGWQEEEEELQLAQAHKVRNAFAALNLEDEEEEGIEA